MAFETYAVPGTVSKKFLKPRIMVQPALSMHFNQKREMTSR